MESWETVTWVVYLLSGLFVLSLGTSVVVFTAPHADLSASAVYATSEQALHQSFV